jgi:hypothetical protein
VNAHFPVRDSATPSQPAGAHPRKGGESAASGHHQQPRTPLATPPCPPLAPVSTGPWPPAPFPPPCGIFRSPPSPPPRYLQVLGAVEPSRVSSTSHPAFASLRACVAAIFPHTPVAPALFIAASDSKHFWDLAPQIYRFNPVRCEV